MLNLLIFNKVKNWIKLIGINKVKHNQRRYKTVVEAFGAIKEIKLSESKKFILINFHLQQMIFQQQTQMFRLYQFYQNIYLKL